MITPDIGTPEEGAPDFTFFTLHVLVVWAAIYLTCGRGMRPRWPDYRFAVVATLDVLGPWPIDLLTGITLVLKYGASFVLSATVATGNT